MSTAKMSGSAERPVISARVPEKAMKAMAGRLDQSMPVGNEGAGVVVKAGSAVTARALLGKIQDKVALVNIVRKQEQVGLLKSQGAKFVCNTESPDFMTELTEALAATGATIAFDAIGGGKLAAQIPTCMEAALNRNAREYSRYGSATHKQVYLYGMLDTAPTEFIRSFGMAWGMGGWLLCNFLGKIGPAVAQKLRQRVAAELKTTFASSYSHEVSLAGALQMQAISVYGKRATGAKYLINPNKGFSA